MDTDPVPQEDPTTDIDEADLDRALRPASVDDERETYRLVVEEPRETGDHPGPSVRRHPRPE